MKRRSAFTSSAVTATWRPLKGTLYYTTTNCNSRETRVLKPQSNWMDKGKGDNGTFMVHDKKYADHIILQYKYALNENLIKKKTKKTINIKIQSKQL